MRRLNLKSHAQAGQLSSLSPATRRQKIEGLLQRKVWLTGERKRRKKGNIHALCEGGSFVRAHYYKLRIFMPSHVFSCQSVYALWRRLSWSSPVVFCLFILSVWATFLLLPNKTAVQQEFITTLGFSHECSAVHIRHEFRQLMATVGRNQKIFTGNPECLFGSLLLQFYTVIRVLKKSHHTYASFFEKYNSNNEKSTIFLVFTVTKYLAATDESSALFEVEQEITRCLQCCFYMECSIYLF